MNARAALSGLSFLLSVGGPACGAAQPDPPAEWFRCEADSDCVHIRYTCAGAAVNKSFAKSADDFYALANARTNCISAARREHDRGAADKDGPDVPYKVYCEARQCKVRGTSAKRPGFS